ncbi:MAG: hypothetical protein LBH65_02690, partial [Desulfovibrio sp.]|nr:hypothetical protein [Desulfovibrio sp.]
MAEKVSVQPISVLKPDAGESSEIRMQTHRVYSLAFYPDSVSFEQQGDDMGILFDDAARIVLHDFFVVARNGDFTLELPDGVQLQGKDVAEAMMMSLQDFHTDSPALAGAPADDGRAHAPRES